MDSLAPGRPPARQLTRVTPPRQPGNPLGLRLRLALPTPPGDDRPMPPPATEEWLAPFVGRLLQSGARALDVGCGPGLDAAYLTESGFDVVAFDRRDPGWAGEKSRLRVAYLRADVRYPPVRAGAVDVVLASLSLHYLPWNETLAAFAAAVDCLRPGGCFLFRVNASDDYHHGAGAGEEIEPGFFRRPPGAGGWSDTKRFFTEADVRAVLPPNVAIEHLAHRTIHRYDKPKQVWECLALKLPRR